jgi:hypothetical protein
MFTDGGSALLGLEPVAERMGKGTDERRHTVADPGCGWFGGVRLFKSRLHCRLAAG